MKKAKGKEKRDPATDSGSIILPALKFEDATGKKDVRYYLNEPYLDLRGPKPVLVATNGHVLLAVECKIEGAVSQGSLSLEAIQRCRKDSGKHLDPVLKFEGKMHGTGAVMFERPNWPDTVTYPDWTKVAPVIDQKAPPDLAFNSEYLSLLAKALGCGPQKGCGLMLQRKPAKTKVKPLDNRAAISVRSSSLEVAGLTYHAVLMPMRFD